VVLLTFFIFFHFFALPFEANPHFLKRYIGRSICLLFRPRAGRTLYLLGAYMKKPVHFDKDADIIDIRYDEAGRNPEDRIAARPCILDGPRSCAAARTRGSGNW
jgi:hypothetical protein